jgi:DNA-directed RNA polymerases I, II, and III subunit RPABC1
MTDTFMLDRGYTHIHDGLWEKEGDKVQVFHITEYKLDTNTLQKYLRDLFDQDAVHAVFIYRSITMPVKKMKMFQSLIRLEFFEESELEILSARHRLMPKHTALSQEESAKLIDTYGKQNLPILLSSDPVCRYYAFPVGSVVEIERLNGFISYRLVAEA